MEKYIEGNKEAWEEAFDNRDGSFISVVISLHKNGLKTEKIEHLPSMM